MNANLLGTLRAVSPQLSLLTEAADLEHYGRDWTRRWTPAPLAIALPATVEEIVAIVHWARARRIALVPSGGRTGLSGGAVAADGELVLSLEKMRAQLAFDPVDRLLTVQAGMPLETLQGIADGHGLQYPVDFAARGSASIGGNVATNAGGIQVLRHGNTREWIAGLTVVDGRGEVLRLNRGLVKNSSGYDLRHLFVASEGTLGIIAEVTVRLADRDPAASTVLFALPSFEAIMPVFTALRDRLCLQSFEFFDGRALKHVLHAGATPPFAETHPYYAIADVDADEAGLLEVFETCVVAGWVEDGVIAASDAQAEALWRLREGITESLAPYTPYKNDVVVRTSRMPAFLAEAQSLIGAAYPEFEVAWFGHIGDGNLHINILKPSSLSQAEFVAACERATKLLSECLQRHEGSISAEHGIGLVKKPYLRQTRSEAEIAAMRGIKAVFDPDGIMNPGKVFD